MATQPEAIAEEPVNEPAANDQDDALSFYNEEGQAEDQVEDEGGEAEEAAEAEPELEPIAPPVSLTAEEKEAWKSFPREAQEVMARRVTEMERGLLSKTQELASQRRQVEAQARDAILQVQHAHMAELETFLASALPPKPDPRLLQTGQEDHRTLFYRQQGEYEAAVAQRQQVQQQVNLTREQAAQVEQAQILAQRQQDEQVLAEKLGTDWTEPSARQKLLSDLEPIGGELGYSAELMAQAGATDILALKTAASWKAKADKWDAAQKSKMQVVREAKKLPTITQPGIGGGARQPQGSDPVALLYPNDVKR